MSTYFEDLADQEWHNQITLEQRRAHESYQRELKQILADIEESRSRAWQVYSEYVHHAR